MLTRAFSTVVPLRALKMRPSIVPAAPHAGPAIPRERRTSAAARAPKRDGCFTAGGGSPVVSGQEGSTRLIPPERECDRKPEDSDAEKPNPPRRFASAPLEP